MRKARSVLVTLLLAAITVRVLWWVLEPLVPFILSALVVVLALGFVYYRITRW